MMCDNINDEKKKKKTAKEKTSAITWMIWKRTVKKIWEKKKKLCMITLGMIRKEQVRKSDKKRKMDKSLQNLDERTSIFDNIQKSNRIYPWILTTSSLRLIENDFKGAIQEGFTYVCDIFWKFELRSHVIK